MIGNASARYNVELLIVVPTLNSQARLPLLVDSLRRQSFDHWHVLFIDGPSSIEHRRWLQHCCEADARFSWVVQDPREPGIFGAMNQGFAAADVRSTAPVWLLFWGSDDWAASPNALEEAMSVISFPYSFTSHYLKIWPDLLVCRGRYADFASGLLGRSTVFQAEGVLTRASYRLSLLLGSTPPHQATLFGPRARQRLSSYAPGFRLSADLDYFLQLSSHPGLRVQCLDLELVHMADGGVSGQQTQLRLQEVRRAYLRAFGWRWWFPFLMRYTRRFASLLASSR